MSEVRVEITANAGHAKYWNTAPCQKWLDCEDVLNTVFKSLNDRLLARALLSAGERILDIGCGTGATTRDIASRIGHGSVVGVDLSRPLLERAEEQKATTGLGPIQYLLADAKTHHFEPNHFELLVSLIGEMFFADPVADFQNLFVDLHLGGRLSFVSSAPMSGNPWFEVPRDAAVTRLGKPTPPLPGTPGPLSFAEIGITCWEPYSKRGFRTVQPRSKP